MFEFFNIFQELHTQLCLDHNTRYWSKIWRQVHALVDLKNGGATKLRKGTFEGLSWPIPWSMFQIWPSIRVRPEVDRGG
jgi:hypothetical protein